MSKVLFKAVLVLLAIAALSLIGVEIYYLWTIRTPPTSQVSIPQEQEAPTPAVSENFENAVSFDTAFKEWEAIKGSEDKCISLTDFQKVRVGFELSPLFGDHKERSDATVFGVEKNKEGYEVLGYFMDFTPEEVNQLIKPNSLIKIYFKKKRNGLGNFKDENGYLLAHWLLIKREGGKAEVEEELGRGIPSP